MVEVPDEPLAPMPSAVKRLNRWYWMPVLFIVAVVASSLVPDLRSLVEVGLRLPDWVRYLVLAAPFALPPLIVFFDLLRINRAVWSSNFRCCTHCVQDLNGLADKGLCPECGKAFDIEADRKSWARAKIV